jgi:hypothetical protein
VLVYLYLDFVCVVQVVLLDLCKIVQHVTNGQLTGSHLHIFVVVLGGFELCEYGKCSAYMLEF